jgi:hypothetical protein
MSVLILSPMSGLPFRTTMSLKLAPWVYLLAQRQHDELKAEWPIRRARCRGYATVSDHCRPCPHEGGRPNVYKAPVSVPA